MDEQKKSPHLNNRSDLRSCHNCGFPLRSDDKVCMFCRAQLQPTEEGYLHLIFRYFQQFQWGLRLNRKTGLRFIPYLKYFAFLGVGILLTLVGGYMFYISTLTKSFSNCMISLLFLLPGIYTLKTLYRK